MCESDMAEMKKEVSIRLWSKQYEAANTELFANVIETFGDDVDFSSMFKNEDEGETLLEMRSYGTLTKKDGRISLFYDETELTGMEGSTTTVSFAEDSPDVVTMLRYGSVSTALVFEQGKRHICAYETRVMPFEICIQTRTVKNGLTMDGGRIDLDYLVEIHGAKAERTIFSLEVTVTA